MIFDAVVVGAGPAGSTLARCLAREGLNVMLMDKEPIGRSRACGGFLGPEVRPLLMELDLDDMDSKVDHYSIPNVEVSSMGEFSFKTALTHGRGMAVSRSQFDAFLIEHAQKSGVSVHAPATLMSSIQKDQRWSLEIADGLSVRTVQCRFLIYATGRRAYVKKKALFAHSSFYACKATYRHVDALSDEVVLHFVRKGHVGLNPLGNGTATLCLYTDEANIKNAKGDLDNMMSDFMKQNTHLEGHLRSAERVSGWQTCQAEPDGKKVFYREGAFYVGDAVSMVHPIIGGGIPIAMQSAQLLSQELVQGVKLGSDPAQIARRYEKKWKARFLTRTRFAATLGRIERSPRLTRIVFSSMQLLSGIFPFLVQFSRPEV
jgi:flavin-dependent dehydrogenase